MRPPSVNSEILTCLLALALVALGLLSPGESLAASPPTLEEMVEESLACRQKAIVLEVGLEHLTKEEVQEQRALLAAQVTNIQACVEKGLTDLRKGRDAWKEKVKRMNDRKRHSASHLREAGLRSTIGKILDRTKKSVAKLLAYLAD